MDFKHIVVFITVDSQEAAQKITDVLLSARKAACVNIIPKVESHYWWQGKIESAAERLLIVKTRAELLDDVITLVKKNHPYTVPEIIALPIIGGNEDYLRWVEGETGLKKVMCSINCLCKREIRGKLPLGDVTNVALQNTNSKRSQYP